MLKAILVSLLFVVSSGKLSCNNALCLQDTFQGIEASGDCSECAKIIFNWLMGLVEVLKNNLTFIVTLLSCYFVFVVAPVLLFTVYLFSKDETYRKPLHRHRSNEELSSSSNNSNHNDNGNYSNNMGTCETELNPLIATPPLDSGPARSKTESCICDKTPACSGSLPSEEQQLRSVAVQPNGPMTAQQLNKSDLQFEESPEKSNIESADSVTLLWDLGSEICQEPKLRKDCAIVASGLLLAIGIYRLLRK